MLRITAFESWLFFRSPLSSVLSTDAGVQSSSFRKPSRRFNTSTAAAKTDLFFSILKTKLVSFLHINDCPSLSEWSDWKTSPSTSTWASSLITASLLSHMKISSQQDIPAVQGPQDPRQHQAGDYQQDVDSALPGSDRITIQLHHSHLAPPPRDSHPCH